MSHRIALSDFKILLSKLQNRKFNPTGICDEGDGLESWVSFLNFETIKEPLMRPKLTKQGSLVLIRFLLILDLNLS